MVLVAAVRDYVIRMLHDIHGMKVLLLDSHTVGIVSVALSQSELLQKEVFLVEKVDASAKEVMTHLKAVAFLRPTPENIQHLKRHLNSPRFGEFHLFFSNLLKTQYIQVLADADVHEAVQQVQEFYADYFAIDPYHFTLNLASNYLCMLPTVLDPQNTQLACDRMVEGIAAVFLSMKRRPAIRYQRSSEISKRIATDIAKLMYEQENGLFDFRRSEIAPLLLVVDRRDDPVTPLLNQWTYQAMVHELLGIADNRVDLKNLPKVPQDLQEVVLSSEQDPFFKSNMYENFGDLGANIKKMVDDFQSKSKNHQNIQSLASLYGPSSHAIVVFSDCSIPQRWSQDSDRCVLSKSGSCSNIAEDMVKFVENYPEYRKQQGGVSKHVTLMTEMSRIVDERQLMSVSQVEQELACSAGQPAAFEAVVQQLSKDKVTEIDRLRLVMLYALRYEKENPQSVEQLISRFGARSSRWKPALVHTLLRQCGVEKRTGDLYGNRDLFNRARNMARGLKGVENVYTQHQPLLAQTIENIVRGRLRDVDYPFVGNHFQQGRPQDVVIFIVGGSTYEEARTVALQNAAQNGTRVFLGGTLVHNSSSFISDLEEVHRMQRVERGSLMR